MKNPILKFFLFTLFAHSFFSCEQEVDPKLLPTVSTAKTNSVSYYSARSGGVISADGGYDVVARGVCWSTSPNPTIGNSKTVDAAGTGEFVSSIDSLMPNITYFVRAYATNKKGTAYGLQETFTTMQLTLSELTTSVIADITTTSAQSGGSISFDGGSPVISRGVCYATLPGPTVKDSITKDGSGTGNFVSSLTGLKTGTVYYVRAYAENSQGASYGNELQFKTQTSIAEVTTRSLSFITSSSALSGGEVVHDGGAAVTERGVCWSTSPNPKMKDNRTRNDSGMGSFTSTLSDLLSGTQYYVRAYAANYRGPAYGEELTFTTLPGLPVLTTTAVSNVTTQSASSGGTITHDGGAAVTARGVCWSTSKNPTISNSNSNDGTGSGQYASSITGLRPYTTYYVRAYASNSLGTAYGNEVFFHALKEGEVYNMKTGKIWMDRNLGAARVATSIADNQAYGDLYQWGRGTDGHEKRNSPVTTTMSSSDTTGHGMFIKSKYDWRSPENNNLWQGVDGVNNPCPEGFRLPTLAEWNAERASWSSSTSAGAFTSALKLPAAGYRHLYDGSLKDVGINGNYWSATVDGTISRFLYISSGTAFTNMYYRVSGYSVRCIKN